MQGNTSYSAPQPNFATDSTHVHGMTPYPLGERLIVPPPGSGYDWFFLSQFHNDIGGATRGVRGLSFQDLGGFGCCILAEGSSGVKITTDDQKLTGKIHVPSNRPDAWRNASPGTYESRFTTDTTSRFGNRQYNSTRWFAQLNTPGAPVIARARGWYACGEYVDATLTTKTRALTLANGTAIFPGKTLTYSIGAGALWAFAYIDPDIHHGSKGTVLFENRTGSSGSFVVPPLESGIHVLLLGSWEKVSGCGGGWNGGVERIPFRVN
jgi:hypothetical protein